ncbi:MAG: enoyl-CoA hydratase-related protein [Halieaceae bacterium]|jgi:isohexenylglutaconyl-CoA hydratase|nr:enoyl-CoA hydratase-related protein [Halieaceae bacterium]
MLPDTTELLLEQSTDTLTIWFNRPESRNALSRTMADELTAVLEALPQSTDIRFVILRGKGGTFCAGGDLKMFNALFHDESLSADALRERVVAFNAEFGRTLEAVSQLPQLFIVLIEGAAMAGGLGLACIADVALTTADARYALSEVTLGIPPAQIAPLVARRVGLSEARRLLLTAQRFDGREAHRLGFVHGVVDDAAELDVAAKALIEQARRAAPGAVHLTKQILAASEHLDGDALVQFAAQRFADGLLGDEGREGMSAFVEKRPPRWAETGT